MTRCLGSQERLVSYGDGTIECYSNLNSAVNNYPRPISAKGGEGNADLMQHLIVSKVPDARRHVILLFSDAVINISCCFQGVPSTYIANVYFGHHLYFFYFCMHSNRDIKFQTTCIPYPKYVQFCLFVQKEWTILHVQPLPGTRRVLVLFPLLILPDDYGFSSLFWGCRIIAFDIFLDIRENDASRCNSTRGLEDYLSRMVLNDSRFSRDNISLRSS